MVSFFRFVHVPPVLYHAAVDTAVNVAVTVTGPLIVTVCGVVVPVSPPVNPLNWYPLFTAALTETALPALYQPLAGLIVPPADGLAAVVR
jgi:hypothetical protein